MPKVFEWDTGVFILSPDMNQIWREQWNNTKPTSDTTFEYMVSLQIKSVILQLLWRL